MKKLIILIGVLFLFLNSTNAAYDPKDNQISITAMVFYDWGYVQPPLTGWSDDESVTYVNTQEGGLLEHLWCFSGTITKIPSEAFRNSPQTGTIIFPSSLKEIGYRAFYGCSDASLIFPEGLEIIGVQAFQNSQISSLSIGGALREIGMGAFEGCSNLSDFSFDKQSPISYIPQLCFSGCSGLTNITIPNSVESVEEHAFSGCSGLTSLTIGSGIRTIGSYAFASCPELADVYCHAESVPTTQSDAFKDSDIKYATLHVPAGSVDAYKAAEPWKNFKEIVAIPVEGEITPTDVSTLTDAIYATPTTAFKGSEVTLTICLKNVQATSAYSFDLLLPEGFSLVKDGDDYYYELSNRHNGHSATVNYNETAGVYSFAVLSLQSEEIKDNDGAIWTLKLHFADETAAGSYAVKIQNAKYSLISGSSSVILPEVTSLLTVEDCIKGDSNGDGYVDIADAVCIVNHIVGKPAPAFVAKAADANGDGVVDIADAVRIVNLIVGKIPALAPRIEWNLPEPE